MRIQEVEAMVLAWPPVKKPFWMAYSPIGRISELVVRVTTTDGIIGIGEVHARGAASYSGDMDAGIARNAAAGNTLQKHLKPLVLGEDPLDNERLWEKMFQLTYTKPGLPAGSTRESVFSAIAGIDQALWDIKGKAAGMPVFKLLGGHKKGVPCLVTGGYYQEGKGIPELVKECEGYVALGYRAMKLKAGGLSVEEDVERMRAVRNAVGPGIDIVIDVNGAYDIPTAVRAGLAYEEAVGMRWYEEPVHWYNRIEGHRRVAEAMSTRIGPGSHEFTRWEAMQMALHGGIRIMQFDCTQQGGPTEWLKIAHFCDPLGITMAPHHDPQIHGHLLAAVPNAEMLETFPEPERDPIWAELFTARPEIKNSEMELLDKPGWGLELDEKVVQKRKVSA